VVFQKNLSGKVTRGLRDQKLFGRNLAPLDPFNSGGI
jgi:hypothetical protein